MRLRSLLLESGPWGMGQDPLAMVARIERDWSGALVHMTQSAAKRKWRAEARAPRGAAERLAHAIADAVVAEGGSDADVDRILLAAMGGHIYT